MAANWNNTQVFTQLNSGYKWSGATITYAFPTSSAGNISSNGELPGFIPVGSQQVYFRLALQTWGDLIPQTFQQVTTSSSNIEFGYSSTMSGYAHAYFPSHGSAWFSSAESSLLSPVTGSYGFQTLIHEMGHALGLNHMGNYNGAGAHTPSSYQDSVVLSIMSYFGPSAPLHSAEVMSADWVAQNGTLYSPQTPMVNDVMAIQAIYGASTTTRLGDTVYGFSSNVTGTAANLYDFSINKYPILTLFDSGGIDTLNLSGWSSSSYINLEAGAYSSCNYMTNNIAIAYSCVIENAVGGSGADTLSGNSAANQLFGGDGTDILWGYAGNDTLVGGLGNDTIYGGDGDDTAVFSGNFSTYTVSYNASSGTYSISGASGLDLLSGVEYFQFGDVLRSSSQLTSADVTAPTLTGFSPADNATAVAPGANLVLSFSEAVQASAGNFVIYNSNGTVAKTISATDTSQVTISGNTVTINPTADLAYGSSYYINVGAGVLKDMAGNGFAGLSGTTAYNFTTVTASAADDYAGDATTTGSLVVNGIASRGLINAVDDTDMFKVTLAAGMTYVFNLSRTSGQQFDPYLDLYGSAMTLIVGDNDGGGTGNARITYTASTSGTYYLGARNAFGTGTGTGAYTLSAATSDTKAPTLTSFSPADNATSVAVGANIVLEFSEAVVAGSGSFVLYNANGTVARTISATDASQVTINGSSVTINPSADLSAGASYYLNIGAGAIKDVAGNSFAGITGTTAYNFTTRAATLTDDYSWSTATTGVVTVNGTAASGVIEVEGDHDLFKVNLVAGTTYVFNLARTLGGMPDPKLELWDPSVNLVTSNDDGGGAANARITYTATTTGTYYLGAYDSSGMGRGGYTLSAATLGDDYPWSTSTTGVVNVNGAGTSGAIEVAGDLDMLKVTLTAGVTYVFDLTHGSGGLADPYLQLWSPNVSLITANDDGGAFGDARITYTAATSGVYYLGAYSATSGGTGAYTVSAKTLSDDFPWNTGTNGSVTVNGAPTSGAIEVAGDLDLFKVTLTAGTTYVFDLARTNGGLTDPSLQLWSPKVELVASDDNGGAGGNARITYTATTSGTYYLGAFDALTSGSGAYTISAKTQGDDLPWSTATTGVVTVDGAASSGSIEIASDLDLFKVTLTAGISYVFDLARTSGGLIDPYLQLWSPSVQLLVFDDNGGTGGNARITYTATESGTFYLGAMDAHSGSGAYTVSAKTVDATAPTVQSFSPTDNATSVTPGSNLVLGFSEVVQAGSGNFTICTANGSVVRTIAATDTSQVSFFGSTVTINPATDLAYGTSYYLNIDIGAVTDLSGNRFSGIANSTTYNFSTVAGTFTDDYSWDTGTSGVVLVNQLASQGVINAADDADLFKVDLVAGASYVFSLNRTSGGLTDPYLQLWSPDIELLAFDDDSGGAGNSRITFKAATTGTYYLGVWDFDTGTGGYTLSAANVGTTANDTLVGASGVDVLSGYAGNDWLDGAAGADSLIGGAGNDTYVVDDSGDVVVELRNEGTDLVRAAVSTTLSANVENLTLTGSGSINGSGNELNNVLLGNDGNNWLSGAAGIDLLTGGAGDDRLDGGAGADMLMGGLGSDTYVVDSVADVVSDSGGSDDTVITSLAAYTLGAQLEHLTYVATGAALNFIGTGNGSGNQIIGGSGNDRLSGLGGSDTLSGNAGNDTLLGGDGDDVLIGGAGADWLDGGLGTDTARISGSLSDYQIAFKIGNLLTLSSNGVTDTLLGVEKVVFDNGTANTADDLTVNVNAAAATDIAPAGLLYNLPTYQADLLTGTASGDKIDGLEGNDAIVGAGGNDTLLGGVGNDILSGGAGNDTLTGGVGNDLFVFDVTPGSANADQILDFALGDKILLDQDMFSGLALGSVSAAAFYAGTAAHDESDRLVYDKATGNLYYDADGTGASEAVLLGTLTNHAALSAASFVVF